MVEGFRSPLAADALRASVAIITGGGTGIGAATARAVVAAGGRVAICGRRPEPLEAVTTELGDACLAHPCDIREPDQVAGFLDAVRAGDPGGVYCTPADALATLRVALACERALERGTVVSV